MYVVISGKSSSGLCLHFENTVKTRFEHIRYKQLISYAARDLYIKEIRKHVGMVNLSVFPTIKVFKFVKI